MQSHPLNEAFVLSLMKVNNLNMILENIDAELRQMKIWFEIDPKFGAFGSTLFSEKTAFILNISDNCERIGNYSSSAIIQCKLLQFCAEVQLSYTEVDAEVSNLSDEIFAKIMGWKRDEIPSEQYFEVIDTLRNCGSSSEISDVGLMDEFMESWKHLI